MRKGSKDFSQKSRRGAFLCEHTVNRKESRLYDQKDEGNARLRNDFYLVGDIIEQ